MHGCDQRKSHELRSESYLIRSVLLRMRKLRLVSRNEAEMRISSFRSVLRNVRNADHLMYKLVIKTLLICMALVVALPWQKCRLRPALIQRQEKIHAPVAPCERNPGLSELLRRRIHLCYMQFMIYSLSYDGNETKVRGRRNGKPCEAMASLRRRGR